MPEGGWKNWLGFDSARQGETGSDREHAGGGSERVRITAVIAVALAVGLLIWLLLIKGDDSSSEPDPGPSGPQAAQVVPESELLTALEGVGYPVYWAGPRAGVEYEVSRPEEGRTFVRYLPEGESPETERPFLTVGSYQQPDALARIEELGQKPGAVLVKIAGEGAAYSEGPNATNAYLAFPGVDTQVEVFDPQAGQALRLIRSGAIVPVG
ncbi:MAG TPA: hypothetical protein VFM51_11380 [Solirubrobacterales bacterium]|nr:hypothetical protein [Solirubrobacterales bacterium]